MSPWKLEWCTWGNDAPRPCGQCEAVPADVSAIATHAQTGEKRWCPLCHACLEVVRQKTDPPPRPRLPHAEEPQELTHV